MASLTRLMCCDPARAIEHCSDCRVNAPNCGRLGTPISGNLPAGRPVESVGRGLLFADNGSALAQVASDEDGTSSCFFLSASVVRVFVGAVTARIPPR